MSDLKPIEEGCLALTFNCLVPSNNGKIVRVGKFLGEVEGWGHAKLWETDIDFIGILGWGGYHMTQENLLRIDDPDLTKEEEEEVFETFDCTKFTYNGVEHDEPPNIWEIK